MLSTFFFYVQLKALDVLSSLSQASPYIVVMFQTGSFKSCLKYLPLKSLSIHLFLHFACLFVAASIDFKAVARSNSLD